MFQAGKKFALAFGIAIIFPMMLYYGVGSFSPPPDWEDFYQEYRDVTGVEIQDEEREAEMIAEQTRLREQERHFEARLFFVSTPMGIIAIIAGTLIPLQAVGTGLLFGGVLSITRGCWGYWTELPEPLRFASLVVALIVLIVAGYKKLDNRQT